MGDSPVIIFPVVKSLVLHVGARPASASLCWGAAPGAGGVRGWAFVGLQSQACVIQRACCSFCCWAWVASRAEISPGRRAVRSQVNGTQLHEAGAPGPSLASLRKDVMGTGRLYSALPCWSELHGLGMKVRGRKPCGGRGEFTWQ